jgi:hypothetical protein
MKTIPIVYIRALSRALLRGGEFAATFNLPLQEGQELNSQLLRPLP